LPANQSVCLLNSNARPYEQYGYGYGFGRFGLGNGYGRLGFGYGYGYGYYPAGCSQLGAASFGIGELQSTGADQSIIVPANAVSGHGYALHFGPFGECSKQCAAGAGASDT
jgi:hypothetical protein